jgi:hypothetical protein
MTESDVDPFEELEKWLATVGLYDEFFETEDLERMDQIIMKFADAVSSEMPRVEKEGE